MESGNVKGCSGPVSAFLVFFDFLYFLAGLPSESSESSCFEDFFFFFLRFFVFFLTSVSLDRDLDLEDVDGLLDILDGGGDGETEEKDSLRVRFRSLAGEGDELLLRRLSRLLRSFPPLFLAIAGFRFSARGSTFPLHSSPSLLSTGSKSLAK